VRSTRTQPLRSLWRRLRSAEGGSEGPLSERSGVRTGLVKIVVGASSAAMSAPRAQNPPLSPTSPPVRPRCPPREPRTCHSAQPRRQFGRDVALSAMSPAQSAPRPASPLRTQASLTFTPAECPHQFETSAFLTLSPGSHVLRAGTRARPPSRTHPQDLGVPPARCGLRGGGRSAVRVRCPKVRRRPRSENPTPSRSSPSLV
jgi:hypothetical protein